MLVVPLVTSPPIRLMKDGVIADFYVTEKMLQHSHQAGSRQQLLPPQPARAGVRAVRLHPGRNARHQGIRVWAPVPARFT